jgi:hypothetical protein
MKREIFSSFKPKWSFEIDGVLRNLKSIVETNDTNEMGEKKYLCTYSYMKDDTDEVIDEFKGIIAETVSELRDSILQLFDNLHYSYADVRSEAIKRVENAKKDDLEDRKKDLFFIDNLLDESLIFSRFKHEKSFIEQYMELDSPDWEADPDLRYAEINYYNECVKIYKNIIGYIAHFETCKYETETLEKDLQEYWH